MATQRILRTQQVTLSHVFDPDEIPTAATGSVTVTLARLDGTVVSTGSATGPDATEAYTYPYAGSATLDILTVTWAATVAGDALILDQDRLEIVGAHMFGVGEARAADPAIADPTKYPTADIAAQRIVVEDEAANICGQSFAPRFAREILDGTGMAHLRLGWPLTRAVRKVSVANTFGLPYIDFTPTQLGLVAPGPDGVLRLDSGWNFGQPWVWGAIWPIGRSNIIVEYEHGLDVAPSEINRVGKIRVKSLLLQARSALPDRAERIAVTEVGTVLLAIPGQDRTGIPEVDAAYSRFKSPRPDFG